MKRPIARLGAVILASALPGLLPAADEGRTILETAVAAHGGLERFRAIRSWHILADRKIEDSGPANETYEEYLLRYEGTERTMLVKRREGSELVFVHDGRRGFAFTNGVLRDDPAAPAEAYYRAHGEYYLRSLPFKWLDPGMTVVYAGRELLGERQVDLLRIRAEGQVGVDWNDVWIAAIDSETHRLAEARLTHHRDTETWLSPRETGIIEITYRYSDYREVKGVWVPFRLEYVSGGRVTGENVIRTIELDGEIIPEIFTPSAHVRR